jgi:hypothetical protein
VLVSFLDHPNAGTALLQKPKVGRGDLRINHAGGRQMRALCSARVPAGTLSSASTCSRIKRAGRSLTLPAEFSLAGLAMLCGSGRSNRRRKYTRGVLLIQETLDSWIM